MNLVSLYHININCRDFDRSMAFYQRLGFSVLYDLDHVQGEALATLLALPDVRGRAAILQLDEHPRACRLDLIEWIVPPTSGAPSDDASAVGFARLCFYTKNIEADYESLQADGVTVLSEPLALEFADGSTARAFCFRDPDGTLLELIGFD